MKPSLITAVDIGTAMTRVVVAELRNEEDVPYIIGAVELPSVGVRRGSVVDLEETSAVVADAVRQVGMQCGHEIESAVYSLGGVGMTMHMSKGVVIVGRADGQIDDEDVDRVLSAAQAISLPTNKEIVHVLPRQYKVDDQSGIKDPVGMKGVRLEIDAVIIDVPMQDLRGVESVAQTAQVAVEDTIVAPLVAAHVALDRQQKELGVVLVDIGAATTSVAVYEENDLVHVAVLPIGAAHITNDIAIGLRTSVTTAEQVKLQYGAAIAAAIDRREECDLSAIDPQEDVMISRHYIAEIIQARLEEIFALVQGELEKIGKSELLPAGAVLTGGGAKLPYIVPLAKEILHLPVQVGEPQRMSGIFDRVDDPAFVTALGLVQWQLDHESQYDDNGLSGFAKNSAQSFRKPFATLGKKAHDLFEKFLP